MTCTIGEVREIGGKWMKCVNQYTHGAVYRKGCYWVYTEEEPYKPPSEISCFYDAEGYHIFKPIKTSSEQCNLNYHAYIARESKSEMEKCLAMGGYWDGAKCYYGGGEEETPPYVAPPPEPEPTPEPEVPTGPCPRGRRYQAPILGNCDPGYYREKTLGRDMCVCEEGAAAETPLDKLGDYLSGNLKMILIVVVVIVIGMVVMKVASKKVSVG